MNAEHETLRKLAEALNAGVPSSTVRWPGNDGEDIIYDRTGAAKTMVEGAIAILALLDRVEALEKALEPFAQYAEGIDPKRIDTGIVWGGGKVTTYSNGVAQVREWKPIDVRDFRRAAALRSGASS